MCFFFNDTATTEIYTLSLHDALPISQINTPRTGRNIPPGTRNQAASGCLRSEGTRLNSSHVAISYAVFCLKKKNTTQKNNLQQQRDQVRPNRHHQPAPR